MWIRSQQRNALGSGLPHMQWTDAFRSVRAPLWCLTLLLAINGVLGGADEVLSLPGWEGRLPAKQWSGFLDVSTTQHTRLLHYWLVASENRPVSDPVVLWLNGGPVSTAPLSLSPSWHCHLSLSLSFVTVAGTVTVTCRCRWHCHCHCGCCCYILHLPLRAAPRSMASSMSTVHCCWQRMGAVSSETTTHGLAMHPYYTSRRL